MTEQKKQDGMSVLDELTQAVRDKVINQRGFAEHQGLVLTDDDTADAAMRAFVEHLHDPRTIERACENYFKITGTKWKDLNERTQEMWRKNMQVILQSVLE